MSCTVGFGFMAVRGLPGYAPITASKAWTLDFETFPRVNGRRVSVTWRFVCKDEEVASNSGVERAQRCASFEVQSRGNPNMKRFLCS